MNDGINLMEKFLDDRRHLRSIKDYVAYNTEGRPHLIIAHPAILATFMGYLKFQTRQNNKEVYFRGQTKDYNNIIPSLLRGEDLVKVNLLSQAYDKLKSKTKNIFKADRFRNETIDNLFQHYGIKSQTLDLVDNIYIAIWFATNSWKSIQGFHNLCTYTQSDEEFGWIYFMQVEEHPQVEKIINSNFDGYCDLRKFHSSLSARLHCQHGITYFRNNKGEWNSNNRCFDDLLIATVKFPNSEEFKMNGTLFTKEFLFPNSEIDNTYKLLKNEDFTELLFNIEKEYNLESGELGQIWTYNF